MEKSKEGRGWGRKRNERVMLWELCILGDWK